MIFISHNFNLVVFLKLLQLKNAHRLITELAQTSFPIEILSCNDSLVCNFLSPFAPFSHLYLLILVTQSLS